MHAGGDGPAQARLAGPLRGQVVSALLTVPWAMVRLRGSDFSAQVAQPATLDALLASYEAIDAGGAGLVLPSDVHRDRLGEASWTHQQQGQQQQAVATPSPSPAGGSGQRAGAGGFAGGLGTYSLSPPAALPVSAATSPLSPAVGSPALPRLKSSAAAPPYTAVPAQVAAWPAGAYLLGNLAHLLTDPLPEAGTFEGAADGTAPSPSGGAGAAATPTPAAAGGKLAAAYLSAPALARALRIMSTLVSCLPEDALFSAAPMVWQRQGASTTPFPMPAELAHQLRRLSGEKLAKTAARTCMAMDAARLANPRLRLRPDEDPERGSYDEYSIDAAADTLGGSGGAAGGTHLTPAVSTATSVLRSVWETSKLALSLFKRRGGGGSGGSGRSVAAAAGGSGAAPVTGHPSGSHKHKHGGGGGGAGSVPGGGGAFDDAAVHTFVGLYAFLVAPRPRLSAHSHQAADSETIVGRRYLLSALAFSPSLALVQRLWYFLAEREDLPAFVRERAFKSTCGPGGAFGALALLASLLGHLVNVVDDFELYTQAVPLPLRELRHAVRLLRDVVAHAEGVGVDAYADARAAARLAAPATPFWPRFAMAAVSALRVLYDRHCQRPLGPPDMWVIDLAKVQHSVPVPGGGGGGSGGVAAAAAAGVANDAEAAAEALLPLMPFAVPFAKRAEMFDAVRAADRRVHQMGCPQVPVTIQRSRLFESAYAGLAPVRGEALKRKIYVTFINSEGLPEAGIDAGGLFKELWTSLAGLVFDPSYGLWTTTERGEMYPNPASRLCSGMDDTTTFEFLGRVLGKALYEGITLGPQFARFFLHKLLGRPTGLHHLAQLDPELYKSLMFLKQYDGDVADLALSFTLSADMGASGEEVELLPGGADLAVTAKNRMQYIYMVADARLK
jgi:hypothetical protein